MCRDESVVSKMFLHDSRTRQNNLSNAIQTVEEYSYPLLGSQRSLESANRVPVRLSKRTFGDFDPPSKLKIEPEAITKTQYERYTKKL